MGSLWRWREGVPVRVRKLDATLPAQLCCCSNIAVPPLDGNEKAQQVALLWLALHASREAALAKRLEEDYGYKAAIASCLEGFQKQMSQFGKDVESNSPLARLLNDTLATIAAPPGRIYDKHKLVVSPMDELKTVTEAAKALKLP